MSCSYACCKDETVGLSADGFEMCGTHLELDATERAAAEQHSDHQLDHNIGAIVTVTEDAPAPEVHKHIPHYEAPDLSLLQLVRIGDLNVDPTYQRQFNERRNAERVRDFRPNQIGFLEVSRRADGSLWIVDGQHRAALLMTVAGQDTLVPALVYTGLTLQEESDRFIYVNNHRASVQPVDIYRARRARGDETVIGIDTIVGKYGMRIGMDTGNNVIAAASALLTIESRYGMPMVDRVLGTLKATWGSDRDAYRADVMLATAWVLSVYNAALDTENFILKLREQFTAKTVINRARARRVDHGGDLGTNVAAVLIDAYNTGLTRAKKMPTPVDVRPHATKRVNDTKRLEELQREARDARRRQQQSA